MLAERLYKLRKEKKKTQADMANLLGITRQAYGYYEKGERDPDTSSLNILADFFNVSIDYLVGRVDDPHAVLSEDVRLFVDSLELTDKEILDKINLINVDGRPLSREEAIDFIAFVRTKRAMEKQ